MATGTSDAARDGGTVERDGLHEVVDGEVVLPPPLRAYEAELASLLDQLLGFHVRTMGLGRVVNEMLFQLDRGRDLQRRPDVAFLSADRWPLDRRAPRTAAWDVVPDLAIEITSPTNAAGADLRKVEDYFRAGVRAVWVVHPAVEKVYAYDSPTSVRILARGDELDGGAVVPGFRLALGELFGAEEPR
jgi:Uma2 family endonuclease